MGWLAHGTVCRAEARSGALVEALIADHLSLALQNEVLTERLSAYQADTDEQFAMGDARMRQLTDRLDETLRREHGTLRDMVNDRVTAAVAASRIAPPSTPQAKTVELLLGKGPRFDPRAPDTPQGQYGSQVISDSQIWMASLAVQMRALGAQLEDSQRVRLAIALIAARDQVDVARDFPDDTAPAWSEFEQYMLTHYPPRDPQRRAVTEWGELKLPASKNGDEAAIHSYGQSVLRLMREMGDRAPVSPVGALHSYISSLHPELKKFVWDKYCESGQQWEGSLSDRIPKAYSLVQGYLQGHTLSSGGGLVEQRGLAQKRPLADAAASVASGEHARKRQRQSATGAKGTGPTPAVGMRQTEQQPPKDPRIPKQLDPVAHNEKAYLDDGDPRSFSSELAHALMSEQRCLFCRRAIMAIMWSAATSWSVSASRILQRWRESRQQ